MPALPFIAVAGSLYSGYSSMKSANAEAKLQKQQGDIAEQQAQTNATNEAYNQRQTIGQQQLAFLANGVSLEGSPAAVLAQSYKYGQSQVQSILNQGAAQQSLAYAQAKITQNQGRAALIGSIASAASMGSKDGLFDSSKSTTTSTTSKSVSSTD